MKIGIVVVYLFNEETEYLLSLHIGSIRKYTDVPYRIYGSVSRLDQKGREALSLYPEIQQCEIPQTDLRDKHEHAHYLDHLTKIAFQDGSTHLIALHLDSFPISYGWIQKLLILIEKSGSFVALDWSYTACLFFSREFYLQYRPTFRSNREDLGDFPVERNGLVFHSGIHFFYLCFEHGLCYHILKSSLERSPTDFADLFGGIIFHLRSATRFIPALQQQKRHPLVKGSIMSLFFLFL
jgi:hypothetical protein